MATHLINREESRFPILIILLFSLLLGWFPMQAEAALEDSQAWQERESWGFRAVKPDPEAPGQLSANSILAVSAQNAAGEIKADIDPATADQLARARVLWQWGLQPASTWVFPVYNFTGEIEAYEVLLLFRSTYLEEPAHMIAEWEGYLADYRTQATRNQTEANQLNGVVDGLLPPAASILISANLDSPPIRRTRLGLPSFFTTGQTAVKIAGNLLGSQSPRFDRLLFLGTENYAFQFSGQDRSVIVLDNPTWSWIDPGNGQSYFEAMTAAGEKDLANRAGGVSALDKLRQDARARFSESRQKWLDGRMEPQSNVFISGYAAHFQPFHYAEYGDESPRWAEIRACLSMPMNYYDNSLNYGNLITHFYNTTWFLGPLCHTPNAQAVWDQYLLNWVPIEFHDAMKHFANSRGYAFVDGISIGGDFLDWRFDEGQAEIDADRPFVWTNGPAGVDFPYVWVAVGYDASPNPPEWILHLSNSENLVWRPVESEPLWVVHLSGPRPGGEGIYSAHITYPDGNQDFESCENVETLTATQRTSIRWTNWDNPAWYVEIDYSADGGRNWTNVTEHREDIEWYRWTVPCGAVGDSTRVRIRQYDWQNNLQSADGSFGNFRVLTPDCSDLVVIHPTEEHSDCTGTSVLFSWLPMECADFYVLNLGETGQPPGWTYQTAGNEIMVTDLTPGLDYYWNVTIHDVCGGDHTTQNRFLTVGEGALAAPQLTAPENEAPCIAYPSLLTWNPVPAAVGYQVELGFSCGGNVQVYDVTDPELPLAWLEDGRTYFWRVRAQDDCGNYGDFSACWAFTSSPESLPSPALLLPEDGATGQIVPGTLVWDELTGAEAYEVQLGISCGTGSTTLIDPAATEFTYTGLDGDTTYHWRARGRSFCGDWGDWSGCFTFTTRSPATWLVKPDGTGDFPTIQAAVDNSIDGDIIELADGTFLGAGNRNVDLGERSLIIRSRSGHRDSCIINVEGHETNPARGFLVVGGQGPATILEGFTVENAYLAGNGAGAGMIIGNSSPTIRHCDFEYNHANDGGALFLSNSASVVFDCEFRFNGGRNSGGAIRASNNSAGEITFCRFFGNSAVWGGGAIYNFHTSTTLSSCIFSGNSSEHWGGALHNSEIDSAPWVFRCTFDANFAPLGGAIYNRDNASSNIQNTIISNSLEGEAVYCTGGAMTTATCSNIFGNAGGDWVGCLAGQETSPGNLSVDPWYCLAANHDYALHFDSPCAAGNNPTCAQVGAEGVGCGPHEPATVLVQPDGTGDYPTIQAAIDALPTGSTILLGDGIFTGAGNRDMMPYSKNLTYRSQSQNPAACIIDCEGSLSDPHRAFYFSAVSGATQIEYITFRGGSIIGDGGAIQCQWGASPVIIGCVFEDNSALGSGGAIAIEHDTSPEIYDCTFLNNSAFDHGGAIIFTNGATVEINGCWFRFNSAFSGGALAATDVADVIVHGSVFDRNEAANGGALLCYSGANLVINESTLARNSGFSLHKTLEAFEGATNPSPDLQKIQEKDQSGGGGVFCGDNGSVTINSSIIAFSLLGEAVLCDTGGTAVVTCSDLFSNVGGDWVGCVAGLEGTSGNISLDPRFCNSSPEDLYLGENSPCGQDSPEPGCDYMGALPVDCGAVPVDLPDHIPGRFALFPAVPNPFNAGTELSFDLMKPSRVSLVIFDVSGRRITVLINAENKPAGRHAVHWFGRDDGGRRVAGGVYFFRLTAGEFTETKRMVLVK